MLTSWNFNSVSCVCGEPLPFIIQTFVCHASGDKRNYINCSLQQTPAELAYLWLSSAENCGMYCQEPYRDMWCAEWQRHWAIPRSCAEGHSHAWHFQMRCLSPGIQPQPLPEESAASELENHLQIDGKSEIKADEWCCYFNSRDTENTDKWKGFIFNCVLKCQHCIPYCFLIFVTLIDDFKMPDKLTSDRRGQSRCSRRIGSHN